MKMGKKLNPSFSVLQGQAKLPEVEGFSPWKSLHLFKSQLPRQLPRLWVKELMIEISQIEAPKEDSVEDTSGKDLEEVLKIIRRSDYKIVEQLGQTPSKISMLSSLLCSEAHV